MPVQYRGQTATAGREDNEPQTLRAEDTELFFIPPL